MKAKKGAIREAFLRALANDDVQPVQKIAARFDVTRAAVSAHARSLVKEGLIEAGGSTRSRVFQLRTLERSSKWYSLAGGTPGEDQIFREAVAPVLDTANASPAARDVAFYAVTEMINNAIDHSEGRVLLVDAEVNADHLRVMVSDDGVGVFKKVADAKGLHDEREAIVELTKGRVTTAPKAHSGEGIFFSSRASDFFTLSSGTNTLMSLHKEDDHASTFDVLLDNAQPIGTAVTMRIRLQRELGMKAIFDRFKSHLGTGFSKTVVPVRVAKAGADGLVSRSQGKRLMAGLDKFQEVILDFRGVAAIGQGFADEIFRVYPNNHAATHITVVQACEDVRNMMGHVGFDPLRIHLA